MKIGVCADVHLGNHRRFGGEVVGSVNDRGRIALGAFNRAVEFVVEQRCTHFVVAGDLFDYARPEPALLAAVQKTLRFARDMSVTPVLLVGNHDRTSTAEGDNALAPLAPYAAIVEAPALIENATVVCVPFQAGVASQWLPEVLARFPSSSRDRLLVLHMGIKDDKTPPWLQDAPGAVQIKELLTLCEDAGFACVLAGDWHEHRSWKRGSIRVMQVGALAPTGWDNPGLEGYGSVILWEPGKPPTRHEIGGPRFVKVRAGVDTDLGKLPTHTALFVSEICAPEDLAERTVAARLMANAAPGIAGYEVLADDTIAKADARMAGVLAKSAETFDEALSNYVAAMALPDDVDRAQVMSRTKEFLV